MKVKHSLEFFPMVVIFRHRLELPVLRYHRIRVNYPYPFLEVIFRVILHDLLDQITIKTVQLLPFPPNIGKLPYFSLNDHI